MGTRVGKAASAVALAGGLLAACGMFYTVVRVDPVIAGKRYQNEPIALGPVKMRVQLHGHVTRSFLVQPGDRDLLTDPEQIELSLGFLAVGEGKNVVAHDAALTYGPEGTPAEPVERHQTAGAADGCNLETQEVLDIDYWFNGFVNDETWSCVTIRFRAPGHRPGDRLELKFQPLNVAGRFVRVLPITFERRAD